MSIRTRFRLLIALGIFLGIAGTAFVNYRAAVCLALFCLALVCLRPLARPTVPRTEYDALALQNARLEALAAERADELEKAQADVTVLTQAKIAAENNVRSKTAFLANMSHEIRTPLNAILGLSEVELRNELPTETRINLKKIYSSGTTLLGIINDILDMSKIESGKFELFPTCYDFANLISDTIHMNVVRIASKPIDFETAVDPNTPAKLFGDEIRIKQILTNLLSNAFKYTLEGTVTLTIFCRRREDKVRLTFTVSDTGIGIKKEDIETIFAEYNQLDREANRKIEGTGLGLSICKNLVEL
ncbi:MAG: hypothetical protein LBS00_08420, partial [Synergistaceae bacterium]|nr:hypothetical protein [Synergistaceae bacterium]